MAMLGWLLRIVLIVLIVRALWRLAIGVIEGTRASGQVGGSRPPRRSGQQQAVPLVKDPVCGTYVVRDRAIAASSGGETHYFCSERCREEWTRR
jgi:YHS domain-containing protein